MKKTLLAAALLFFLTGTKSIHAQGNLQFNKSLFMEMTVTQANSTLYSQVDQVITVPANKVWKIDGTGVSTFVASSTGIGTGGYMLINGKVISGHSSNTYSYTPIWLPAGTYTLSVKSYSLSVGTTYNGYISGIEFNIVP